MDFVRKHRETIFIITIIGFLAGIFVGFGSYFFIGKTPADNVLEVNGIGIPYKHFTNLLSQVRRSMTENNESQAEDTIKQKKQEVLQHLVQEELFWQEARKYGIIVSDLELASDLQSYPAFQQNGRFSHALYYRILNEVLHETPREFEESRRKMIAAFKLRALIASSVRITEPELQVEYEIQNKGNMQDFEKKRDKFQQQHRKEMIGIVFTDWERYLNHNLKVKVPSGRN